MTNVFYLHENMEALGKEHKNNSLGEKTHDALCADPRLGKPQLHRYHDHFWYFLLPPAPYFFKKGLIRPRLVSNSLWSRT